MLIYIVSYWKYLPLHTGHNVRQWLSGCKRTVNIGPWSKEDVITHKSQLGRRTDHLLAKYDHCPRSKGLRSQGHVRTHWRSVADESPECTVTGFSPGWVDPNVNWLHTRIDPPSARWNVGVRKISSYDWSTKHKMSILQWLGNG